MQQDKVRVESSSVRRQRDCMGLAVGHHSAIHAALNLLGIYWWLWPVVFRALLWGMDES